MYTGGGGDRHGRGTKGLMTAVAIVSGAIFMKLLLASRATDKDRSPNQRRFTDSTFFKHACLL